MSLHYDIETNGVDGKCDKRCAEVKSRSRVSREIIDTMEPSKEGGGNIKRSRLLALDRSARGAR